MSFESDYEDNWDTCEKCHEPFAQCLCVRKHQFSARLFEHFLESYLRSNPGLTARDIRDNKVLYNDFEMHYLAWLEREYPRLLRLYPKKWD